MHQPTPIQRDNKDVSLKNNLPGYQAKINLLKQIDDAASQMGGSNTKSVNAKSRLNEVRQSESKRTAQMVLGMTTHQRKDGLASPGIKDCDLENLNKLQSQFNHTKTLLGQTKNDSLIYPQTDYKLDGPQYQQGEDLRSLKSEYDYSHKKKFTDVLGNINKPQNGLKGLTQGEKNLKEGGSIKSGMSKISRGSRTSKMSQAHKRFNSIENLDEMNPINTIPEEDQLTVIDRNGNKIQLNCDQIDYLKTLNNGQALLQSLDENRQEVDYEQLEKMEPFELHQLRLLGEPDELSAGLHAVPIYTNKRLYPFHYHQNSEDYKNLGNLHKENRTIEYFPQDQKPQFQTRPVINSNKQRTYLDETEKMQDTLRKSLGGNRVEHPKVRISDNLGHTYIKYDPMSDTSNTVSSGFPLTTNQDFHNDEPFYKQRNQKGGLNKMNNKKATVYNAYVNAMFNSGVFCNPCSDQC